MYAKQGPTYRKLTTYLGDERQSRPQIMNTDAWAIWEAEINAEGDNTAVEYRGREVD